MLTPAQLRAIGEVSEPLRPRRRRARDPPERPAPLARARDAARRLRRTSTRPGSRPPAAAATPCATSPAARCRASTADELFDCDRRRRGGGRLLLRQPATTPTCRASTRSRSRPARDRCNAPEINCIALVGASHDGREGFARARRRRALVGAADLRATWASSSRQDEAIEVLARDPRRLADRPALPRLARQGAAQVHGRRHRRRRACASASRSGSAAGSRTSSCRRSRRAAPTTSASTRRSRPGSSTSASRSTSGSITGDQMIARRRPRRARRRRHPRSRASRTSSSPNVPEARVDEVVARARARSASRSTSTALRGRAIACTGEPHCNFAVAETKTRLGRLIEHLEERFGDASRRAAAAPRRLPARLRPALGRRPRLPGHDRARRGRASAGRPTTSSCAAASGPDAAIGRPLFRRVPTEELDAAVEGLVGGWLDGRARRRELRRVRAPARPTTSSASLRRASSRRSERERDERRRRQPDERSS